MASELTVITHTYDLLIWTLGHTGKFPRNHRYGLGRRIEDKLHDLLDSLVEAKFSGDKSEVLRQAGLRVEELRLLYRAAKDLRGLPRNSHRHATERLQEIGRQLGGWRRQVEGRR
jgi:hypothetical protein